MIKNVFNNKLVFSLVIFLFCSMLFSNKKNLSIDELEKKISKSNGTQKVELLNTLARKYVVKKPEKCISISKQALKLAEEERSVLLQGFAIKNIATGYLYLNENNKALEYFKRSLRLFIRAENKLQQANVWNNIGITYMETGIYNKAIKAFFDSEKLYISTGNEKMLNNPYGNLGETYRKIGQFDKALQYHKQALGIDIKNKDKFGEGLAMNSIGGIYTERDDHKNALKCYQKANDIFSASKINYYIVISQNNISNAYTQLKEYKKAIHFAELSLSLKKKMGDKLKIAYSYITLAILMSKIENHSKADKYIQDGIKLADDLNDLYLKKKLLEEFYKIKENMKDYNAALIQYKNFIDVEKKLLNLNKEKMIAEVETKYEVELKDNKISLLTKDNQLNEANYRSMRNIFVFIFIFVLSILIFIYFRYRLKKIINEVLEKKNRELYELNQTKDKFFSIIAHDLRNPLNSLMSVSQLIEENFSEMSPQQINEFHKNMNQSAQNLYKLLENLLQWARSQTGGIKVEFRKFDPFEIINNLKELFDKNLQLKNIHLEVIKTSPLLATSDYQMLRTVLQNLLSNAIKFTPKNGNIIITLEKKQDKLNISIQDSGIGIKDKNLPKLFLIDSDLSTSGTEGEVGTGLGLILCKEFIELINGTIKVESVINKGSTFTVSIPY